MNEREEQVRHKMSVAKRIGKTLLDDLKKKRQDESPRAQEIILRK